MSAPPAGRDDAALVRDIRAGEERAFTELMRRHKGPLHRFIRAHIGDADEVYDVLQETFVAAWSALGRFDERRPFGAWLRRIALNKCRDWGRRRQVRRFFYAAASLDAPKAREAAERAAESDGPEEAQLVQLEAAIAMLPIGLKEPVLLTAIEGYSHKQAADILGISAKAVETRIYRGKLALARALGASMAP